MSYSQKQYRLPQRLLNRVLQHSAMRTVNKHEMELAKEAILKARGRDEHVSLFRLDRALRTLVYERKISDNDRQAIMDAIQAAVEKE